jgi:N-acetylmuramoyl-L-alanine amidase
MMARLIQEEYTKLGYPNRGVRRQPLKVLYATDMPSVLTEIGFMSNPAELKHITSEKGQKEIAGAIFRAVKQYIANVRRSLLLDSAAPVVEPKPTPQAKPEPSKESASTQPKEVKPERPVKKSEATTVKRYAIQIMASVKKIPTDHPELKSYRGKVWVLESASALKYKYCYGDYADKGAAQKYIDEVRKEFPQAFIITFDK